MPGSEVSLFFIRAVKSALQNLYDPVALQKSPLIALLDLDPSAGAAPLRQLLVSTIEKLKPDPSIPRDARPWRIYWILFYLYISQFSRATVATNLALSVRHVIREEKHAVHVIADDLWSRYHVATKLEQTQTAGQPAMAAGPSRQDELLWLEKSLPHETVAVGDVMARVVTTMQPLLSRQAVRINTIVPNDLPHLLATSIILYQALLNSVTAAVSAVPGGEVTITAKTGGRGLKVIIEPMAPTAVPQNVPSASTESVDMARQLLHLLDGTLEIQSAQDSRRPFGLVLSLRVIEHVPVLVVDDNADTLQLFQRYLAGTRYLFMGTRDPLDALRLAETNRPRVILLDVMLPGMDGWQVLQRLLHAPSTQKTPVIVCSILPEEQLALAMGAARYLRKPVSQTDLLAALDQEMGEKGQEPPA